MARLIGVLLFSVLFLAACSEGSFESPKTPRKQISRIKSRDGGHETAYSYDKKGLVERVTRYIDGKVYQIVENEFDNGKLVKTTSFYEDRVVDQVITEYLYSGDELVEVIEKDMDDGQVVSTTQYKNIVLTNGRYTGYDRLEDGELFETARHSYANGNLERIDLYRYDSMGTRFKWSSELFEYDNMKSPFHFSHSSNVFSHSFYSPNNLTHLVIKDKYNDIDMKISYEYDGKWPAKSSVVLTSDGDVVLTENIYEYE